MADNASAAKVFSLFSLFSLLYLSSLVPSPSRLREAPRRRRWFASSSALSLPGSPCMALDPDPLDVVLLHQLVELLPEVDVLDRLLVRGAPAPLFPVVNPDGDAVLAHTGNRYAGAPCSGRFSEASASITAVSSMRLLVVCASPPNNSFSCIAPLQPDAPPTRPRIAFARAVGVDVALLRSLRIIGHGSSGCGPPWRRQGRWSCAARRQTLSSSPARTSISA